MKLWLDSQGYMAAENMFSDSADVEYWRKMCNVTGGAAAPPDPRPAFPRGGAAALPPRPPHPRIMRGFAPQAPHRIPRIPKYRSPSGTEPTDRKQPCDTPGIVLGLLGQRIRDRLENSLAHLGLAALQPAKPRNQVFSSQQMLEPIWMHDDPSGRPQTECLCKPI